MLKHLRSAFILMSLLTLLLGVAYPLAMTGLAQTLFPAQARGGLIVRDGVTIGSRLIGQNFRQEKYFHGRPSATTDVGSDGKTIEAPYNAMGSSGSNLGPISKALIERVKNEADALRAENPKPIPVDLVTTSASGLDPHISVAAAKFQLPRVARARGLSEAAVQSLVAAYTERPLLGVIGEPIVHVLELNLALDRLEKK
ncbi:K(+) transporting P-type ATPase subunit KdpC [Azospirillaceae bacterium]